MAEREYTIKRSWWRGMVVLVRYKVPAWGFGDFEWGRWQRAGLDEQRQVLERLNRD